ncbi:unnamed protein product [Closterium sp. Naga37s-1]|nr:unnamed protein product [Closterium sp. Naga37s-1]
MARPEPQQGQVAALEEPTAPTVSAPRAHQRRGEGMRPRTDQPGEGGGYGEKDTEGGVTRGVKAAVAARGAETNGAEADVRPEAAVVAAPGAAAGEETPDGAAATETTAGQTASRIAEERVPVSEQGLPVEVGLAASPVPVAAAEIAAVVTAAVRGQEGETDEADATAAAVPAGTSAAVEGACTRGRGQAADERQRREKSIASPPAAPAARGKKGKWPRAQPAARRPEAGLGPGSPGPLLGWLLPEQSPQELTRPSSSQVGPSQQIAAEDILPAGGQIPADRGAVQEPEMAPPVEPGSGNRAPPAATEVAAAAGEIVPPQLGTRRSARLGAITWGPPRGG